MRISVEIIHFPSTSLSMTEYVFWFDERDRMLKLDHYYEKERKTKRHNYKVVQMWSRLRSDKRNDTLKNKPEVNDFIKQRAVQVLIDSINFEE